jgi:hypothetical protein
VQLVFSRMSLFKIPLILSSAAAMQVALTAPNHSSSDEIVCSTLSERLLLLLHKYGLTFAKVHICSLIISVLVN